MGKLFLLDELREVIETFLYTARIEKEVPLSLILVGPSGAAKSQLLKSYQEEQIHATDSISSMGMYSIITNDTKNLKKFILIPDINPSLSRRSSTAQATISNLLSLTADGTVRVDDGRQEKQCQHDPMGLITACTPEIYDKHARQWFALGLRRRIIPVFYKYRFETQNELQTMVREDKIHSTPPDRIPLQLNTKQVKPFIPKEFGIEIEKCSLIFSKNLGKLSFLDKSIRKWQVKDIVPVSPHVALRALAMAHSLRRKSAKVAIEDMKFLERFLQFTDPENPNCI